MLSRSLVRRLMRYRSWMIAIINAGITWVILIIAPLGLFAVIICTVLVFLGSLATGMLSDLALLSLLPANSWDAVSMGTEREAVEHGDQPTGQPQSLPRHPHRRQLPEE